MRLSKTWFACDTPGCEAEVLVHRAAFTGWWLSNAQDLCPRHAPRDQDEVDVRARAAGEDED